MTDGLRARHVRSIIPVLGALGALLLAPGSATGGIAGPQSDARADATVCDTTSPPAADALILDLASARFDGFQDGAYRFELTGFRNLSDEVRDNPARSPNVAIRIAPGRDRPAVDLRRGVEGGGTVSGVFDLAGQPVAGARLAVDRGPSGEAIFSVSGLDVAEGATWAAFTRFTSDGQLVCDKLDGAFVDDVPALPLETTGSPPAAPTTAAPTTAAPAPEAGDDDGFWWPRMPIEYRWLLGGTVGLFGLFVLVLLLLWLWRRLPQWFPRSRRFREGWGSHGAPSTPPKGQNDFGE